MTVSSLKIASIVLGTGGVVTGLGVGIHQMSKPSKTIENKGTPAPDIVPPKASEPSIAQSLSSTKELLEVDSNDAKWNENWNTFKGEYASKYKAQTSWTFDNWDTLQSNSDAPQAFKQRCKDNSEKPRSSNETLLPEVEKFCAKDKSPG